MMFHGIQAAKHDGFSWDVEDLTKKTSWNLSKKPCIWVLWVLNSDLIRYTIVGI